MTILKNQNKYYVYGHFKLGDAIPFYIRKGSKNRSHDFIRRNRHHKFITKKYKCTVDIFEYFESSEEALLFEIKLIAFYKSQGGCYTNFHPGGLGGDTFSGLPENEKIEFRNKMRDIVNLRPVKCLKPLRGKDHPNFGKTCKYYGHTPEGLEKIRQSKLGSRNPMFGKTGKNSPKFKGWYVTPAGTFETAKAANIANNTQYSKYYCKMSKHKLNEGWYFISLDDSK